MSTHRYARRREAAVAHERATSARAASDPCAGLLDRRAQRLAAQAGGARDRACERCGDMPPRGRTLCARCRAAFLAEDAR